MVLIMNLSIPKSVKQYSIERKYYKKYFYKIVLKIDESKLKPGVPRIYHPFGFTAMYTARQELIKEIAALPITDADCKIRSENRCVSVFTNDVKFIELLFKDLSHRIIEYHRPVSEEHKEVVDQNRRIRVRKRLFENEFKYKVYFSQDWRLRNDKYSDIKLWLDGLENTNYTRWAVNKTLRQYFNGIPGYKGYTAAVYLNDPEDLMMCQVRFHNEIEYIEEAVLISSL
jgi:hypothetical protein